MPERFRAPVSDIAWHQFVLPRLAKRLGLDVLHVPSYPPDALAPALPEGGHNSRFGAVPPPQEIQLVSNALWPCRGAGIGAPSGPHYRHQPGHRAGRGRFFQFARYLEGDSQRIDHARFFPGDVSKARAFCARQLGLERPFILYVARLEHPAKNHVRLIAAFDRFKAAGKSDWQLVLAGGDWHGAADIHQAIRVSASAADIRCLGFVPDAFLPDLYRAASLRLSFPI